MHTSAEFLRRQRTRASCFVYQCDCGFWKVWNAICDGVSHTVHGMKDFSRDGSWLVKSKLSADKYNQVSYSHAAKQRHVLIDIFKMIPFSFFLIIPGAELVLPLWLKIFPNSLPSQFISDDERQDKINKRNQLQ